LKTLIPFHRLPAALWGALFLGMSWSAAGAEEPSGPAGQQPPAIPETVESPGTPFPWSGQPLPLDPDPARPAGGLPPPVDNADKLKRSFENKYEGFLGMLSTRMNVSDPDSAVPGTPPPYKFQTEQAMRLKVTGPLTLFGQLGADCNSLNSQELKLNGKTGLAWKWQGWPLGELQVRGGPSLTYDDPLRPVRMKEQSEVFLELQCKCPLPGKVNLEYQSSAIPALNVTERDRLKQDLHLAFPLGTLGKLNLGAKHSWESTPASRTGTEGMEYYIGIDLKR
jgi:Protein of unknown function, DUF481